MKRLPIIAGAAATAALAGTLIAGPALADNGSSPASTSTTTAAPLTASENAAIDRFLADHPLLAHALADRAAAWEAFVKAHPDIAAEIVKVKALPADQRRAELKAWLTSHPDARKAISDFRSNRRTQRQDRRTQRQDRRGAAGAASTTSLSG
jgi:hemophore-related protein